MLEYNKTIREHLERSVLTCLVNKKKILELEVMYMITWLNHQTVRCYEQQEWVTRNLKNRLSV